MKEGAPVTHKLSHIDAAGKPKMVDVTAKDVSTRIAEAAGRIRLAPETVLQIRENNIKKGNVLVTAELAGVTAAKRTSDLIPLCHPLLLTHIHVDAVLKDDAVEVKATVQCRGRTGVEMEALIAVSTALLTVYDMCKAVDKHMVLDGIHLVRKEKFFEGEKQ